MVHRSLLALHVVSGVAGLLLGPLAMAVPKRRGWHPRLGFGYQAAVATLTVTALGLAALAPARLWWLALIAVATEAAALGGWAARRRHRPDWLPRHVRLMCGSYVSILTAVLVVNWSNPVAWILPTIVAVPLIRAVSIRAGSVAPTV